MGEEIVDTLEKEVDHAIAMEIRLMWIRHHIWQSQLCIQRKI